MTLITEPTVPVAADELCDRLGQVRAELAALAQSSFMTFSQEEAASVAGGVEQVTRGVEALQYQCVGGIEAGQAWSASGYRSFARWWTVHTHRKQRTSSAAHLLARDLRDRLPLTADALLEGRLGIEHANAMAAFTKTEAHRQQLLDDGVGEAFLVAEAAKLEADEFARLVKEWATRTDPGAADRSWREQTAQRELFISQVLDGTDIRGWLGAEEGQLVSEALRAVIGTPSVDDERSPAQRRADALVQLCRSHLDSGDLQPGARIRPHIAITVDYATLERLINATRTGGTACSGADAFGLPTTPVTPGNDAGHGPMIPAGLDYDLLVGATPGTFANGTPIPHGQLAKLLCDGEFHRVVFGPEGEILDSGRTQRLFTAAQTRAIIARDRHCQYPGCTAPPGIGEIHHCLWWYHQGGTSTDNGILLCWWHHTVVHQRHLTITQQRNGPSSTGWVFTDLDGRDLGPAPPPAPALPRPPPRE
ncbi:HNH endonuclease [Ruania zhangjianzhongii]|uniref:HNH endonuclease n=1 Tax=Ruania zhangjianzhongii TaxID=2603206 RepID=UPI0011C9C0D0|nr:HNH endonuclease signature motif containing protein [Ruania zhangjianzhongii]